MFHDFEDDETQTSRPYEGLCKRSIDGDKLKCTRCANYDKDNHDRPLAEAKGEQNDCCNGFMGYYDHPHIWSNCSVRFFRESYVSKNWAECMKYGKIKINKKVEYLVIFLTRMF